jgi:hypothetical protein
MYVVQASVDVDRSADDVWAYMADLRNLKGWDPDVLDVQWQPPAALGQPFTIVVDLGGGRPLVGDARIASLEPGRRIGWEARPQAPGWITGDGKSRLIATYSAEPRGVDRARLTRRLELEGHGLLRILTPALAFLARRQRYAEVENLKRILEGSDEPSVAPPA